MRWAQAAVLAIVLAGCQKEAPKHSNAATTTEALEPESVTIANYREVETTDVSIGRIKRFSVRIVIPPGHSRAEVTATLQHVARELQENTGANAVNVFAYRAQDQTHGPFTIGRTVFAPDGDWAHAASNAPKRFTTDLNDLYFNPPKQTRTVGDTVVLADSLLDEVVVSDEFENWGNGHVIATLPNGTRAVVREARSEALGNYEMLRYRVRILGSRNAPTGWVFDGDTRPIR